MMRFAFVLAVPVLGLVSGGANADALLFPYIASSDTVATIVSVVNQSSSERIFLQYFFKENIANTAACNRTDRTPINSERNDLVSFAANGEFQGDGAAIGGPLFNDPQVNVNYGNADFTMGQLAGPRRALLIVDDDRQDGEHLYGEAIVLETAGGAAWGYRAYNPADDDADEPTFDSSSPEESGANAVLGEVLDEEDDTDLAPVTLLPANEWTTRFFVTPLADSNQRGCTACRVSFRLNILFDRDGNPQPPSNLVPVVCVGGVDLQGDLLPASSPIATQGGWGFADVEQDGQRAAVVIKLEFNKPGTNFISPDSANTFTGTVNNAVWLTHARSREGTSGFQPLEND